MVDVTGGLADPVTRRAYDADTLQLVFSTNKGAAAICAAMLHQRRQLDYDAPVAEYWPEFAAAGKGEMTVGWMMSHPGEVVRRITGRRIGEFLRAEIAAPFDLGFWIGLPEEQEDRVAPLVSKPPDPAAAVRVRAFMASTWNLSAVASIVQPSVSTQSTMLRRCRGVNRAFGC